MPNFRWPAGSGKGAAFAAKLVIIEASLPTLAMLRSPLSSTMLDAGRSWADACLAHIFTAARTLQTVAGEASRPVPSISHGRTTRSDARAATPTSSPPATPLSKVAPSDTMAGSEAFQISGEAPSVDSGDCSEGRPFFLDRTDSGRSDRPLLFKDRSQHHADGCFATIRPADRLHDDRSFAD